MKRLVLLAFTTLLAGCTEQSDPVSIAGNQWLGYQPYYLAYEQQRESVDEQFPLRISMQDSTTTVLRLMSNGRIDGAFLTLDEALQFQSETDMDLCISQIVDYSNGADAFLVDPTQFPPQPSAPFAVGFESTALGRYMFRRAVEELALDPAQIELISLEPAEQLLALEQGRIQGLITFEPHLSAAIQQGARQVFSSADIPGEVIDVLVFKRDVWNARSRNLSLHLDKLWSEGIRLVTRPSVDSAAHLESNTGLSAAELKAALSGVHYVTASENLALLKGSLPESIDSMTHSLIELGMMNAPSRLESCR